MKIHKDPRKRQNPNLKRSSSGLLKKKRRKKESRHDEKITGDVYPVRFVRRRFDSSWVYVQAVAPSTLRERLKKPKLLLCVVPRPQTMEEPTLGFTKGRVWVLVVISTALDQDSSNDRDGHTGLGARTWCGPSFKKSSVLHCWSDSMNNLTYISFATNYTSHQQNSPKPRPGGWEVRWKHRTGRSHSRTRQK